MFCEQHSNSCSSLPCISLFLAEKSSCKRGLWKRKHTCKISIRKEEKCKVIHSYQQKSHRWYNGFIVFLCHYIWMHCVPQRKCADSCLLLPKHNLFTFFTRKYSAKVLPHPIYTKTSFVYPYLVWSLILWRKSITDNITLCDEKENAIVTLSYESEKLERKIFYS